MKKILGVCGLLAATAMAMAAQSSDERWLTRQDLNGDGVADSVWCNPNADGGAGVVEVIDGSTGALIVRFVGDAGARFGAAASAVDDISGDGLADLVVGAPGQQRAYLIDGPFADVAGGDTDLNVAVDTRDLATVVDGLGMPSPEGAVDGGVTRDGAIDGGCCSGGLLIHGCESDISGPCVEGGAR